MNLCSNHCMTCMEGDPACFCVMVLMANGLSVICRITFRDVGMSVKIIHRTDFLST